MQTLQSTGESQIMYTKAAANKIARKLVKGGYTVQMYRVFHRPSHGYRYGVKWQDRRICS